MPTLAGCRERQIPRKPARDGPSWRAGSPKSLGMAPHGGEGAEEWQVGVARERDRGRVEGLGKLLEEISEHPTHGGRRSNF